MRPAADREDAHDVDLQRDHRAGDETDGEIEREPAAGVQNDVFAGDRRRRDVRAARREGLASFIAVLAGRPGNRERRSPRSQAAARAPSADGIGASRALNCCGCP